VTGDAASTACAIARQVGIVSSESDLDRVTCFTNQNDSIASFNTSSGLSRNAITAMDLSRAVVIDNSIVLAAEDRAQHKSTEPQAGAAVLVQGNEIDR
jgi:magnesium-transporting ATPase (P-type)